MIKILDLFAGTQSVKKALDKLGAEFDYIGIDIYKPNTILDLSQDEIISKLKKVLPKNWKPDIIWASPICTPFSRATGIKGGTLGLIVENNLLRYRTKEEFDLIKHKAYYKLRNDKAFYNKHHNLAKLGMKLIYNTYFIVSYFKVPFFIENPAMAISRYHPLITEFKRNVTDYCAYGFPYKKPTAIYSNFKLNLLRCTHKQHNMVMSGWKSRDGKKQAFSDNKRRSIVPTKLIQDIFLQVKGIQIWKNT